jgi:type IV secretion system protein VirB4
LRLNNLSAKGERGFSDYLAYGYMAAPGVIALKNGSYMMGYRYTGPDFGSATRAEIEHLTAMANNAMRRLGNGWMAHFESVRRPADAYPSNHFTEPVNTLIDLERETQHRAEGAHFETIHFVFFTYLPPAIERSGLYRKITENLLNDTTDRDQTGSASSRETRTIGYMENALGEIIDVLGQGTRMRRIGFLPDPPDSDGGNENNRNVYGYDEMVMLLNYFVNGLWHPIRLTPANTAYIDVLLARDVWFSSPMVIDNKHVCVVSLMDYPQETCPGILRQLTLLPCEIRWSNRFIFSEFRKAQAMLDSQRRKWAQRVRGFIAQITQNDRAPVNQDAAHMVGDVDNAMEELAAGWVGYGKHTGSVIARGASKAEAERIGHEIVKVFERNGFPARVETVNAAEAFLGSLPGHGYENVRKPYINTLNLTHIVPLTNEWAGEEHNPSPEIAKHYESGGIHTPPPALLQATSVGSTPFRLNIHVSDLGHTLILGPSGSGKSTLLALIVSQFERYKNAQIFVFDKGYSMLPLCLALRDSAHYDLGSDGSELSLCPLAEIDKVSDQGAASEWLESMLVLQGGEPTPRHRAAIAEAIKILAASTCDARDTATRQTTGHRTMTDFLATLQDEELRQIFSYYSLGHTGEMLDGKSDDIRYARTTVFELEHLFNMDKKIVIPVFVHIFKQIERRILSACESGPSSHGLNSRGLSGRPSLIVIDEAWLALSSPVFAGKLKEWLKVLRKNNCAVILATQSLNDIVNSPVMDAVLDSCETRILLPNPNALSDGMRELYMKHLALNEQQVAIIAHAEKKREYFYACETMNAHRLFSLTLGPVALAFAGAAGKEDLTEIRRLAAEHGKSWPGAWLERRGLWEQAETWRRLRDMTREQNESKSSI